MISSLDFNKLLNSKYYSNCWKFPSSQKKTLLHGRTKVDGADVLVFEAVCVLAFGGDEAVLDDVAEVGDVEGCVGVLLNEKCGRSTLVDPLDGLENFLHDVWRKPEEELNNQVELAVK